MTANLRFLLARNKTATAASRFGVTDAGLLSLEALVAQARTIAGDTQPLEDFLGYKDAPGRSK